MKKGKVQGWTARRKVLNVISAVGLIAKDLVDYTKSIVYSGKCVFTGVFDGPTKDFWAVDIGIGTIKMVRLKKSGDKYVIRDYFVQEYSLPQVESFSSRAQLGWSEAAASALSDLLRDINEKMGGFDNQEVIFSISGLSVFTRRRILPPVPESKVKAIVKYEIQQQIPFGLEKILFDYAIMDKNEEGCYEIFMAAVKTDLVNNLIKVFEKFNCRVHGVTTDVIATYNWLRYTGQLKDGDAIVYIQPEITQIAMNFDNQFTFTRPLDFGSKYLYDAANQEASQSAEIASVEVNDDFEVINLDLTPPPSELLNAKGMERLSVEIKQTLSYFRSLSGCKSVDRIVLIGRMSEIEASLQEKLGLEVVNAQSSILQREEGMTTFTDMHMVAVLGLALSLHQDVALDINLLSHVH